MAAEVESYAPVTNGNVYNNHYHMLFEIRDGKIAVVKEYADTAARPRSLRLTFPGSILTVSA